MQKRQVRHRRVRARVFGTKERPRLSVFRSNKYIILQLVDDEKGKTILQMDDRKLSPKKKITKTERAYKLGEEFAKAAKTKKINRVVFDKGGYFYHGRIKAIAEGVRKGGFKF